MILTKEDLQSIGVLIDSKLEPVNARLDKIETEMKQEVRAIHSKLGIIEADMKQEFEVVNEKLEMLDAGLKYLSGYRFCR